MMLQKTSRVLFLYTQVQPFLISGIKALSKNNVEVLLVQWKPEATTPFKFENTNYVSATLKEDISEQKVYDFAPDIVYVSGWMDKDYMKWAKHFKKKGAKVIMGMDAQWTGSIRQRIHCVLASSTLHSRYTHSWVPGYFQYEYARRLGFSQSRILKDLLTPDVSAFKEAYIRFGDSKAGNYPSTFLYVGRLVEHKFGKLLRAFSAINKKALNGWKLIVAGDGPLRDAPEMRNENIIYKGFLHTSQLADLTREAGIFCLTSDVEPWGTVVHEFASSGMPLLLSANCGAHYSFLIDGYNGFLSKENSLEEIKANILRFINTDTNTLSSMGKNSFELSQGYSSEAWAARLLSVLE